MRSGVQDSSDLRSGSFHPAPRPWHPRAFFFWKKVARGMARGRYLFNLMSLDCTAIQQSRHAAVVANEMLPLWTGPNELPCNHVKACDY